MTTEDKVDENEQREEKKERVEWKVVKDFFTRIEVEGYDFEYTLCVRVSRSDAGFRPRFSLQMGRYLGKELGENARITPFLPIFARAHNGRVQLSRIHDAISAIVYDAQAYVTEQLQIREDEILDHRIKREQEQALKERSKTKPSGTHKKVGT